MTSTDRTDWTLILLLWAAGLGAAAQYGKVSVVFDRLPELYPGQGASLGLAVSLVGLIGILLGVVAGALVGQIGLRRVLLGSLVMGALVSALQVLVPPFPVFLVLRVLEGVSHLGIVVAAPTLIAGAAAVRDQGFALTLWGSFFGVAFALLASAGLWLVDRTGVPALFAAHALWMALSAAILRPRLPREAAQAGAVRLSAIFERHLAIYRSARIGAAGLGWVFYTFSFVSLLTLLPPFLDPADRRWVMAAIPLVSIAASLTLGVWMLRRMRAVTVVVIGFLGSALCCAALIAQPGDPALCLVLAALLGLVQGASFAVVPELNPEPADRALANGGLAQAGNLGNTVGTPVLLAVIATTGHSGMMGALAASLGAGALAHMALAARRRVA